MFPSDQYRLEQSESLNNTERKQKPAAGFKSPDSMQSFLTGQMTNHPEEQTMFDLGERSTKPQLLKVEKPKSKKKVDFELSADEAFLQAER